MVLHDLATSQCDITQRASRLLARFYVVVVVICFWFFSLQQPSRFVLSQTTYLELRDRLYRCLSEAMQPPL